MMDTMKSLHFKIFGIFIIFYFNENTIFAESKKSSFTFNEILEGQFTTDSFNGTWINDNEILFKDIDGNLLRYNIDENESTVFLNSTDDYSYDNYNISPDISSILLSTTIKVDYKQSILREYRIINLTTFETKLLTINNSTLHQYASWDTDGNGIVCVHKNNVYYFSNVEEDEYYQITFKGIEKSVFNGVFNSLSEDDWNSAIWFSPNNKYLVIGHFETSKVKKIDVPYYGNINDNISYLYPLPNFLSYELPENEISWKVLAYIDLKVILESNKTGVPLHILPQPYKWTNDSSIFFGAEFLNDDVIVTMWKNRIQNTLYIIKRDFTKKGSKMIYKIVQKDGWISESTYPYFINNKTEFLIILPQKQIDNDYWNHLAFVKINKSDTVTTFLTSGTFVVTQIVGYDEDKSLVYYHATVSGDSSQQQFYRLSILDKDKKPECLSCNIKSQNKGVACLYNKASMLPYNQKFILTCGGPDVPHISIYNSNDSTKVMTWTDNSNVAKLLNEKVQPTEMRLQVPITNEFKAEVQLFIPPDAILNGSMKYPMIIDVYAGPDSNQVKNEFNIDWQTYLVTNKNFIYAIIDGRGSGRKSNSMLYAVYRKLGTVEIYDQINVTRYLQNKFSFIDKNKTAILGWSYGGYAAGMSMALDQHNTFKCGISVAPVADWTLYRADYSECYMGLPTADDNLDGYEQAQLLNKMKYIKSNSYYLIHGTFDDNVLFQNSLLLAEELEKNNILFQQQVYTNEGHSFDKLHRHLYLSMENYLNHCLNII